MSVVVGSNAQHMQEPILGTIRGLSLMVSAKQNSREKCHKSKDTNLFRNSSYGLIWRPSGSRLTELSRRLLESVPRHE